MCIRDRNKGYKEYFAVKATPNPFLINILREYGCGCDCSSYTELMLSLIHISIIEHHVDFQFDVATRKYKTLLAKELDKKEIQEGLIKACDVIDLIIEILRGSKSIKEAKACLTDGITENIKFKSSISKKMASMLRFTERQATAILEMRLYKLIGLEIEALQAEHEQTLKSIARYEDILNNYDSMAEVIIEDLDAIKKTYARKRRTIVENAEEAVFEEKKIEEQEVVFLMDRFGYARTVDAVSYTHLDVYKRQVCAD